MKIKRYITIKNIVTATIMLCMPTLAECSIKAVKHFLNTYQDYSFFMTPLELAQTDNAQEILTTTIKTSPYLCTHTIDANIRSAHSQVLLVNQKLQAIALKEPPDCPTQFFSSLYTKNADDSACLRCA